MNISVDVSIDLGAYLLAVIEGLCEIADTVPDLAIQSEIVNAADKLGAIVDHLNENTPGGAIVVVYSKCEALQ